MLRFKFDILKEKLVETINVAVGQSYGSLESVCSITTDDLNGLRSVNETINAFNEYLEEHSKMMDNMASQLDEIQRRLIRLEDKNKES